MLKFTHKKAQMELMGLAIVVLLIAVGMFFAMKYTLFQKPPEIKNPYMQSELATTFVNTLLLASTDECKAYTTMKDLLGDCAAQELARQKCALEQKYCSSGDCKTYCEASDKIVDAILKDTLTEWGKSYTFEVYSDGQVGNYFAKDTCAPNAERGKAGLFPIPARHGTVNVKLSICS